MAWYNSLRDLTGDIKKPIVGAGHAVGSIASNPFVDAGIGALFGPGAAALAGGLGHLMAPGGNLGRGAIGAVEGGAAGYAGQGLGNVFRGAGSAATSAADDAIANQGVSAAASSPMQQGVMNRVMGGAKDVGNFIKDNRSTLETVGQGANGVMNAAAQNRAANIQQQLANAQNAQIQAAIDLQNRRSGAFANFFSHAPPTLPNGAPVTGSVGTAGSPNRSVAPGGPRFDATGDQPTGQLTDQPTDGSGNQPTTQMPGAGTARNAVMNRLGYNAPVPQSPYSGNDSLYGSPYGYGYTDLSRFQGYGSGGGGY